MDFELVETDEVVALGIEADLFGGPLVVTDIRTKWVAVPVPPATP